MWSLHRSRFLFLGWCFTLVCMLPVGAHAQQGGDAVERVSILLRLLDLAYPDVRRTATGVSFGGSVYPVGPWLRELGVQFSDSGQGPVPVSTREDLNRVYFHGVIRFDDYGFMGYEAVGRFLKYRENAELAQTVSLNDDWSDSEVAAALRRAGAAFGPERVTMKSEAARFAAVLADVIGTGPLAVSDISFRYSTAHERSTGLGVGSIGWQAVFVPASGTGRFRYVATYEPLGGKLRFLHRRDDE